MRDIPVELERLLHAGIRLPDDVTPALAADINAGGDLFTTVAEHSPDGLVCDLECLDSVDEYESVLRRIAEAAGRGDQLTDVKCVHNEDDSTCTVEFTFAGTRRLEEPDWFDDYADGMFLAATAEEFAPAGKLAAIRLDEALVVLYVPESEYAWIDELAQAGPEI